jgi:flagellar basal-body rod modification protein FlgD
MQGITGLPTVSETNPYTEADKSITGRDDFLKMFLAQLNNQDPLNPMDGSEFASQLAQFSSLEQLFNVNENLETLQKTEDQNARYQALNFFGKDIIAHGDMLSLEGGDPATGSFTIGETGDCTVLVTDQSGNYVKTLSLGSLGPGRHTFEWDGKSDAGEAQKSGTYRFQVRAVAESGQLLPVETQIQGTVTRVNLEESPPVLFVGGIPVDMAQILDIRLAQSATDEATSTTGSDTTNDAGDSGP